MTWRGNFLTMKTRRVPRSAVGQPSRCTGGCTRCWTPWMATGVGTPTTSRSPFTRRTSAVGTQQHREPDAERRPVERAVDCHAERVDVAVVRADMTGSRLRRRGRRRGLEPAPRLLPRAGRIGGGTGEELVWLNRMGRGVEDRGGRIKTTAGGSGGPPLPPPPPIGPGQGEPV